ncbi:MAG: 4a-hydroxytetrahydrobiopterin dehydratase [Acidobacteriaceae bacterium]|nr:4a-hydroxytetrahydrobiopterin dehydratase [Acidobacteriaceae bacterium]
MEKSSLKPLEAADIEAALSKLQGWSGDQHGLKKTVKFRDFRAAMHFMQACIEGIEQRDHHPVWCNKYDSVDIHLDTFDAGHRVTAKDVDLAKFIDSILREITSTVI